MRRYGAAPPFLPPLPVRASAAARGAGGMYGKHTRPRRAWKTRVGGDFGRVEPNVDDGRAARGPPRSTCGRSCWLAKGPSTSATSREQKNETNKKLFYVASRQIKSSGCSANICVLSHKRSNKNYRNVLTYHKRLTLKRRRAFLH